MQNTHELTDNIITAIEEGVESGGWTKPWRVIGGERPINALTDNMYKGSNILILKFKEERMGYATPYWAGIRQWNRLGAKVIAGEKHTKITFAETRMKEHEVDGEIESYSYFMRKTLRVWNADQIEGWAPADVEELELTDDMYIDACDQFVEATNVRIEWKGSVACFVPSINEVHMPPREVFLETEDGTAVYHIYSTLFHELGHATGHEERLDRKFGQRFGDKAYAIEELVAELTSAFLCGQFGIADKTAPRPDHLKYLKTWFKIIKENPDVILHAASDAWKAVEYLNESVDSAKRTQRQKAA